MFAQKILLHTIGYPIPPWFSYSPNIFFSRDPEVVAGWSGPIIILGDFDPSLPEVIRKRGGRPHITHVHLDYFCTINFLRAAKARGSLKSVLKSLEANARDELVVLLYEVLEPDLIIVNNELMRADFIAALAGRCAVETLHYPGNSILRVNQFDRTISSNPVPVVVQHGGLGKYRTNQVQEFLESLAHAGMISLVESNITGGGAGEGLRAPPEPQIVVSWRSARKSKIDGRLVDYSDLEYDWKPATKYSNAIHSGSSYVGRREASVRELSKGDPLAILLDNLDELFDAIILAAKMDPFYRSELAFTRRVAAESQGQTDSDYLMRLLYLIHCQALNRIEPSVCLDRL